MRLTCPNCGAQYDVDAGVIPESGRDVQCSNCGNTWFQRHASAEKIIAAPAETSADVEQTQDSVTEDVAADVPVHDEPTETLEEAFADTDSEPAAQFQQTRLDEGVTNILREEAVRETTERQAPELGGVETQTDLGLEQAHQVIRDPIDEDPHIAPERHREPEDHSRSGLLPDIEEINSTLAADANESDYVDETEFSDSRKRSGFRSGFILAVVVFAVLALVYVFAPKIAEALPQLSSALMAYVDWVDALRTSVDNIMLKAIDKLTALLAQLSDEGTA